jgi:PncC family amidohydrolase
MTRRHRPATQRYGPAMATTDLLPPDLAALAADVGERLRARGDTVAVAESAAGGVISAALLSVPGASAYYRGGAVVYTQEAGRIFLAAAGVQRPAGLRGATEAFARYEADSVREALQASWGIGETGAAGPAGNPYGDPPGHAWVAVSRAEQPTATRHVLTGRSERDANMFAFAVAALELLREALVGAAA